MVGPIVILIVLLVAIPVGVSMSGAVVAGILGWALTDNGEATHEGSELIELLTRRCGPAVAPARARATEPRWAVPLVEGR